MQRALHKTCQNFANVLVNMTSRHNILRPQLFMFEQTYLEVTLDDIPREKQENHQVGTPASQKPSKPLKLRHSFSDIKKHQQQHFILQDRYERRPGEARLRPDRGETRRDRGETLARQGRDRGETARDRGETGARQRETGARQGRDSARHSRDRGETGARQERDMTEDENMDIYFFISAGNIFLNILMLYLN